MGTGESQQVRLDSFRDIPGGFILAFSQHSFQVGGEIFFFISAELRKPVSEKQKNVSVSPQEFQGDRGEPAA